MNLFSWFWKSVKEFDGIRRAQFLHFVTGCERMPPAGTKPLVLKISFGGNDHHRLPIAHTCFNQIILFDYESEFILKQKLEFAIVESSEFAFR